MSQDEECRCATVAFHRCNDQIRSISIEGCRVVQRVRFEISGRYLDEVANQFQLAVLLSINLTSFSNWSSVVVRRVTPSMSQITPISATVSHVQVQDLHGEAKVVLVEDSFELAVDQNTTFREARTAPRIEGPRLEFCNAVRRGWALSKMPLPIVSGKLARWPHSWIRAVKAERIVVMAIDVHGSDTRTRSIVPIYASVIAQERHNLHVLAVRLAQPATEARIFILRLVQDNGSAIGDLSFRDCASYVTNIAMGKSVNGLFKG